MPPFPIATTGRVLLLSAVDLSAPPGGRAMLSRTNLLVLRDLLGDRLVHVRPPRSTSRPRDAWRGWVDGIDAALIADLVARIDAEGITQMFVDGSNYGAAVAAVKRARPRVRIITFFHNVEARFFWGAMRTRRTVKSVAVLGANWLAEKMAVRRSDILVTLSDRDSAGLRRLYGRGADAVAPMVLEDRAAPTPPAPAIPGGYLLFVGGGFYANIAGIRWFAQEVAPRIDLPVKVVGRAMDELTDVLRAIPNVELVGAADDLAPWYAGATLVIAPIFDRSGMKTKVAEALMYGKRIAATPEALSGYANDVVAASWCCEDADAFVRAVADVVAVPPPPYDPAMRALYERDHSRTAGAARLRHIMAPSINSTLA